MSAPGLASKMGLALQMSLHSICVVCVNSNHGDDGT